MKNRKSKMSEVLRLAQQGKSKECGKAAAEALQTYMKQITKSIGTYPTQDEAFIVVCLRHLANSMEQHSDQTKRWSAVLEETVKLPPIPIEKKPAKKGLFGS